MKHTIIRAVSVFLLLMILPLVLGGCVDSDSEADKQPVLRIYDVSELHVERLEHKLNDLLDREDLSDPGRVERIDETRLAVNASVEMQEQIRGILAELGTPANGDTDAVDRRFRIQLWVLQMSRDAESATLPSNLDEVLAPMLEEFPGHELAVQDFLESYHHGTSRHGRLRSGSGTMVEQRRVAAVDDTIRLEARIITRPPLMDGPTLQYEVNQRLVPGKTLVLGRAHGGGTGDQSVYQVLVAQAEWADQQD